MTCQGAFNMVFKGIIRQRKSKKHGLSETVLFNLSV